MSLFSSSQLTDKASQSGDELWDRQTLLHIYQEMLNRVGAFTNEDISAADDQRSAGRLFAVRFAGCWRYPQFQFAAQRNTIPEMKDVLSALPDEQGWDRLQWFLESHEKLNGLTPLEVWKTDRRKIVEAAQMEHWDAHQGLRPVLASC